ncbi:hypothetical protein BDB00DRAFT_879401 [Zychaea mexicana]|uniref:uncharacterized protein n=1 Tax=Zychaea mexicana TaxID=64656 RepID=UPI0022FEF3D7|nr:uncharacterized protein BDB00DRAFT_879401 [Zychaea mexicana]KAI9477697.1 hypothetical protein BDB00DRAFT_879401 [Zychaea mexicana]
MAVALGCALPIRSEKFWPPYVGAGVGSMEFSCVLSSCVAKLRCCREIAGPIATKMAVVLGCALPIRSEKFWPSYVGAGVGSMEFSCVLSSCVAKLHCCREIAGPIATKMAIVLGCALPIRSEKFWPPYVGAGVGSMEFSCVLSSCVAKLHCCREIAGPIATKMAIVLGCALPIRSEKFWPPYIGAGVGSMEFSCVLSSCVAKLHCCREIAGPIAMAVALGCALPIRSEKFWPPYVGAGVGSMEFSCVLSSCVAKLHCCREIAGPIATKMAIVLGCALPIRSEKFWPPYVGAGVGSMEFSCVLSSCVAKLHCCREIAGPIAMAVVLGCALPIRSEKFWPPYVGAGVGSMEFSCVLSSCVAKLHCCREIAGPIATKMAIVLGCALPIRSEKFWPPYIGAGVGSMEFSCVLSSCVAKLHCCREIAGPIATKMAIVLGCALPIRSEKFWPPYVGAGVGSMEFSCVLSSCVAKLHCCREIAGPIAVK